MKKAKKLLLGALVLLAGVPALIQAWCCLPPTKHCDNYLVYNNKGELTFVDKQGRKTAFYKKGDKQLCKKCNHDIEAHMCDDAGWPDEGPEFND